MKKILLFLLLAFTGIAVFSFSAKRSAKADPPPWQCKFIMFYITPPEGGEHEMGCLPVYCQNAALFWGAECQQHWGMPQRINPCGD